MLVQNDYLIVGEEAGCLIGTSSGCDPRWPAFAQHWNATWWSFSESFIQDFVDFSVPSNRSGDKICMIFSVKNPGTHTGITSGHMPQQKSKGG